ncbi:hypothetical protein [Texcoconibacillus texcoconensis]|uniref:Uncharacterized protein n=1 Tax=Texcoconibacillus texcoconensis TaxID=1095777 RepID=A0A840QGZ9_9BACI|nr:hypothetical protein [Texcoconibacillus texcoconensis]MBB5171932.1 hypothetical protein [Texcoconibacillus texcoconensis]
MITNLEKEIRPRASEERTEGNIFDLQLDQADHFPVYTAEKIKHVTIERTREDIIETLKSYEDGKYTLRAFYKHEEADDKTNQDIKVDDVMDFISETEELETGSVKQFNQPVEEAELLDVDEYPAFVVFDTEDIVFVTNTFADVKAFFDQESGES